MSVCLCYVPPSIVSVFPDRKRSVCVCVCVCVFVIIYPLSYLLPPPHPNKVSVVRKGMDSRQLLKEKKITG